MQNLIIKNFKILVQIKYFIDFTYNLKPISNKNNLKFLFFVFWQFLFLQNSVSCFYFSNFFSLTNNFYIFKKIYFPVYTTKNFNNNFFQNFQFFKNELTGFNNFMKNNLLDFKTNFSNNSATILAYTNLKFTKTCRIYILLKRKKKINNLHL